jgi:hypothetical protein
MDYYVWHNLVQALVANNSFMALAHKRYEQAMGIVFSCPGKVQP